MTFPLYPEGSLGLYTGLALAVLIGIGFGFSLERGGFGSSRRLAAQFYLYDMTVFKVMFTAIVTAMVGLFGLTRLGLVALDAVWINPTFLWPQLVGGFLLGVGFIVSGYCPGTAIVAAASGKIDGVLALGGVAAGILGYGLFYTPALHEFQQSGAHGRLLLSDLLGLSPLWLALAITLMAGLAFMGAEKVERMFAGRAQPERRPVYSAPARNGVLAALLLAGLVLALPPGGRGGPAPASASVSTLPEVTPLELARRLVERNEPWTPLDLRSEESYARESIPGSIHFSPTDLATPDSWAERLAPNRLYILVDEAGEGIQTSTASAALSVPAGFRAARLRGGFAAWKAEILTEPGASGETRDGPASTTALAEHRMRAALYSYFTGTASAAPVIRAPSPAAGSGGERKKKPGGGC